MAQVPVVTAGGRPKSIDCWFIGMDESSGIGLTADPSWFEESGFTIEDGRSAMESYFLMRDRSTALVNFNDHAAIGALYTARKHGMRVPEALSIVGVDNIPLTSVDLDARLQRTRAVDHMIDIL
jgi:DNA-binding LacI/PurR family transcriptional regulator